MEASQSKRPFLAFIIKDKTNRTFLWVALVVLLIEWILFKIVYPYPDFFQDSYSYIDAAARNLDINIWPIGYSKFLRLFHFFTHSPTVLVTSQFLFLEISLLYLFFTIRYWLKPNNLISAILFLFFFCNPLVLYISNYVASDGIFCAISAIWFAELIWVLFSRNSGPIWIQAICIFLAFTLRYNACYYIIITAAAYFLSNKRALIKWAGALSAIPLLIGFWLFSRHAYQEMAGTPKFSILSGWQIANNALYIRSHIEVDPATLSNKECILLDNSSKKFFASQDADFQDVLDSYPGDFFVQVWRAPLKAYMLQYYGRPSIRTWAEVSPVFSQYGRAIILSHPIQYGRYFLLPNARRYFFPSLEKLEVYNMGDSVVWPAGVTWFNYPSNKIKVTSAGLQGYFLAWIPYLFLYANLLTIVYTGWYLLGRKKRAPDNMANQWIYLAGSFWICNFLFSVLSTVNVLRYQFFPMIITVAYLLGVIERLFSTDRLISPRFKDIAPKNATIS